MDYVKDIYEITRNFPNDEKFALTNQLRRAAISIPSNISEGSARKTKRDFCHFLDMARGSLNETVTQLLIAQKLNYISKEYLDNTLEKAERINMMLFKLKKAITQNMINEHQR
ncbi:hypothetical protein IX53_00925 [Kosmotoga pacifica]|uniref:30S ribosomal protein S23 n=2 Tax=Kosmotoga pacifica TaxID=1330330 RepID=A0A0G2Z998_9BACT|nr:hypothetical protein IX53_00925 [Kosmotoga pacifica]